MASRLNNRGAREATNADLGERGRRTGVAMPKEGDVPLTQDGYEDMDAYFKSPDAANASVRRSAKKIIHQYGSSPVRGSQSQQIPSSAGRRARPAGRPDVAHEIGIRGRKTGMSIVANNRMPLDADGMEQVDPFFAIGPASIPPVQRAKVKRSRQSELAREDEEDEGEEEENDQQTANYGRHASAQRVRPRQSDATSAGGFDEEEEEDYDEEENEAVDQEEAGDTEDEDEQGEELDDGEPTPRGNRTGRRQSNATSAANSTAQYDDGDLQDMDDEEEEEDDVHFDAGYTQTMELEGSSYFDKSTRSIGSLGGPSSQRRRPDSNPIDSDGVPSPANRSNNSSVRGKQISVINNKYQRLQPLGSDDSSDDEDIQNSLMRPSTSSARPLANKNISRQSLNSLQTSSPIFDRKGKQKALFRGESDEEQVADSEDEDNEGMGYQPGGDDVQDNQEYGGNDYEGDENHFDDEPQAGLPAIDEEDEGQEQDDDTELRQLERAQSKKRRPVTDDSGHGLDTSGQAVPPKRKKRKTQEHPAGLRRSHRDRTTPLEYWRNEKVVYRRRDSGANCYYEKVGIESKPKAPVRSLVRRPGARSVSVVSQVKRKPPSGSGRLRSMSVDSPDEDDGHPDMGQWDAETDPDGIVWDYVEGKEGRRRVAWTKAMLDPKPTKRHAYQFQRIFTDGVFMAGGFLVIPPGECKPLKPARDNTYMIYCVQGAVRVILHRTEFSISQGGFFLIPRGNSYQINNLTDIDAQLVFMQAREVAAIVEDEEEGEGGEEEEEEEEEEVDPEDQ